MAANRSSEGIKGRSIGGESVHWQNEDMEPAPRMDAPYNCPNEHSFTVPFATGIDIPDLWPCQFCGRVAVSEGAARPADIPQAGPGPGKTHFEQLLGRRSREDGEKLVDDALARLAADRAARR